MKKINLSQAEFEQFRDVQIRPRAGWPAIFSCNLRGEVWPYAARGLTPENEREYVEKGETPRLEEIVGVVLEEREGGGRFFVNDQGVFVGPEGSTKQQVVGLKYYKPIAKQ